MNISWHLHSRPRHSMNRQMLEYDGDDEIEKANQ